MRFINPKTDFAFKKIFGSAQSQTILISFLNGLLYEGQSTIQTLDILNPYQAPRVRGMKDTYLDVKAQLADGTSVIIEMQVLNIEGFEKRILYNAAKAYSTQLGSGDDYSLLNPVIALTITDFVMFADNEAYRSRFILKEKDFLFDYPTHDLELVFVELPKFERSLDALSGLAEQWLFFLKNAKQLQAIPDNFEAVPALRQAFELASQANLTPEELDDLEHQEMFIHDQRNAVRLALRQGLERGLERGIEQGLERGIEQGIEQGDRQAQCRIAQQLLDVLDDATISQTTGLSLDEVQQLRDPSRDAPS
ncbi:MAG: Rpn family recombination-promoting nuclease/putative transposase [Synechococcales cyanobacterium RM1_1_8]|nr:Rpn family recombination-promoting nuclease/putative transposase [Synechococcales cyanobacterium RM1_1_8]